MSTTKRRDSKGRVLRNGEFQRKDGRYVFKYKDIDGKEKCLVQCLNKNLVLKHYTKMH